MAKKLSYQLFILFVILHGCNTETIKNPVHSTNTITNKGTLFTLLHESETNISFQNDLKEGLNANVLVYEYLYNGGGVAVGDFNYDGLQDVYFTSNMGENKFYINLGDFKFKEVTQISKVQGRPGPWKTGISTADVNGDGKLDLYLCYSGALPGPKRKNQLFINQGNNLENIPIFKEEAETYGLASAAYSNQGYFLDYDKDGDLDMLLLNHSPKSLPVLNEVLTKEILKKDDQLQGLRIFNQDKGKFKDVTTISGINGSGLSYGLGIGISDVNNDGWLDFYVSNDYTIPDYLYINNKNGTFTDQLKNQIGHTSHFSMGNNIADINNDGWQDIYTLDMLPEDNKRQKLLLSPDNYEKFDLNLRSGFHYQYMRNMLQINNGNNSFSEIGQLSGVSNTDWSWAPLVADFDNDGLKDLYVTNGYYRDYTNLDFINYMEDFVKSKGRLQREDVLQLIQKMPSSDLTNYYFSNNNGTSFSNIGKQAGIDQPSNSNGAAYADLDNDGDLDLIVNNINKPVFIYKNNTSESSNNYVKVILKGENKNTQGIGSKVTLYANNQQQVLEQIPNQGYLSSVSSVLHFGLGNNDQIDSLVVQWHSGKVETKSKINPNTTIILNEKDAVKLSTSNKLHNILFKEIKPKVVHKNKSSKINDFKRQTLLTKQLSHQGPAMIKADINNDSLDDLLIGGGIGQSATLYLQQKNGELLKKIVPDFDKDSVSLDTDIAVFDANNDGNLDVYIASGGYHNFKVNDPLLIDRLYIGDGKGGFKKTTEQLPKISCSTGTVAVADINGDSHPDIFVGGRVVPGRYPEKPQSYIFINDGKGSYTNKTIEVNSTLQNIGMVTDAAWTDLNGDHLPDLIVIGEFMPIKIFINLNGKLSDKTSNYFDQDYSGLWNTLEISDVNKDGFIDLIAGNLGTNTQFNIDQKHPATIIYKDFDNNNSVDPILNFYIGDTSYPYVTRDELLGQLAFLRQKYTSYAQYSDEKLTDIFSEEILENANKISANYSKTSLFLNNKGVKFQEQQLPIQAQFSPVTKILISDFDTNGSEDVLLLGNDDFYKLRIGKFDANYGTLLSGNGDGSFEYIFQKNTGLDIRGSDINGVILNNELLIEGYGETLRTYILN
ncbi:VCBS repeat-containing protein [Maribacter sp. CXY002]|uniref:VCBS repeat-containing protein n=1 Tax=Maribacter luteocoastalis TaxID=3407671 RepID=UPI003B67FE5B